MLVTVTSATNMTCAAALQEAETINWTTRRTRDGFGCTVTGKKRTPDHEAEPLTSGGAARAAMSHIVSTSHRRSEDVVDRGRDLPVPDRSTAPLGCGCSPASGPTVPKRDDLEPDPSWPDARIYDML